MICRTVVFVATCMCLVVVFVALHGDVSQREIKGPNQRNLRGLCISFGCGETYGIFGLPSDSSSTSSFDTPAERAPDQAKQEMKRALLRLKMNARRFKRKAKGLEYTYEYAMEEYNQVGGSQDQLFVDSDYTKVSVSSNGVVSPITHWSSIDVISIQ